MAGRYQLLNFPWDFWLRVIGDFLTGFGRSMLIPFMLIYLKQESGLATWVVTLLTAIPQLFQLFSSSWGGVLADRYGRKPIMWISLLGSGLVLMLMLSSNYVVVYVGYVLFLIVANFYRPAAMAMITEIIPPARHREAFSILRMTANLGFSLGPLVGSLLFFTHRSAAVAGTISAYVITAGTVFFLHETVKLDAQTKTLSAKERNPLGSLHLLKRDVQLRWAVLTGVFFLMVQLQMFTSFTVIVNDEFRDNGRTLAYLLLINTVGVVFGQYIVTKRTNEVSFTKLLFIALIFAGVGWGVLLLPLGSARFYLALVLVTIGELVMSSGYNPFIASLAHEGEVAQYMSFTQTSSIVALMLGPTVGALGYDLGGQTGYVLVLWTLLLLSYVSLQKLQQITR